ncbi:MAG: hypothetical protein ACYC05_04990 [Sulfuricella sp.]
MTTAAKAKPNEEERSEILEAFRDHDREVWERYHASRLVRRHAAQAALESQFEAELAEAARQLAEDIDDEAFADSIQRTYVTALIIAGYSPLQASLMATTFSTDYRPRRRRYGL